ncbi:MAG: DNA polymerase III subunit gamma/tau [Aeriscardovia sp.]|nr:DNA polymerase III subunit gamma/tau [Aeriscardovia sp.]
MALALYRRYRPDTFDGVIGQDQVTVPLSRALDTGKLTQAYLFSGPRGCGKTSCARILARCLNCEKGPVSHPCGVCPSCRELAKDGSGSIDVVEIDAASHNGVDDAREIRERAQFAPARDRYKIFILDEAHMVTSQGFNALLKIVEEPPEHVMFIFATTEPDKVISTIRSRTHHYPFRLVPSEIMGPYLQQVCDEEKVGAEPGVLSLTMRAGGGSVRDTLSILDQLMAGSEGGVITYRLAAALLGFTPDGLLNDVIDAVEKQNGAALYTAVEKVIVGGYDPRRFVEDLLQRLRDLLVLVLGGVSAAATLDGQSIQDTDALLEQASVFGLARLTRLADCANDALGSLSAAASSRLGLELLAAKLLSIMEEQPQDAEVKPDGEQSSLRGASPQLISSPSTVHCSVASMSTSPIADSIAPSAPARSISATPEPTVSPFSATPSPLPSVASATGAVQSTVDKESLWKQAVAGLPDDLRRYVSAQKVPQVHFAVNSLGGTHILLTFDQPLSQHVFAMAVTPDGRHVPGLVQKGVRRCFGPTASIAPTPVAANGEMVKKISAMTTQELAAVKRAIAMEAAAGAASRKKVPLPDASDIAPPGKTLLGAATDSGQTPSAVSSASSEALSSPTAPPKSTSAVSAAGTLAVSAAPEMPRTPATTRALAPRAPIPVSVDTSIVESLAAPMSSTPSVSTLSTASTSTVPIVDADKDEYSLSDKSVDEAATVSLDTLKTIFDVKDVTEIPAPGNEPDGMRGE